MHEHVTGRPPQPNPDANLLCNASGREDFEDKNDSTGQKWMEHPRPEMIMAEHEFWGNELPHWANQVRRAL